VPAATEPKIEIALVKVRSSLQPPAEAPATDVRLATASVTTAPLPLLSPQVSGRAEDVAPKLDFNDARGAIGTSARPAPAPTTPPAETETVFAKSATASTGSALARTPGTLDQQLAVLSQPPSRPSPAVAVAVPAPAPSAEPKTSLRNAQVLPIQAAAHLQVVRGSPPSTLAAQAEKLNRRSQVAPSATPAPQHLGGPQNLGDSQYEIQIGAFASAEEAEARLAAVQSKTAAVSGHAALTLPIEQQGRTAYRARFAGFSSERATAACTELRRAQVDCFVARPE
jgi:hypothetical protein